MTATATNQFTVTEFRARISSVAQRCARDLDVTNPRFEIDRRVIPVATPNIPTDAEVWPEGDDLADFMMISDKKRYLEEAGVLQHGACVHLRISTTGMQGELKNVYVIWMGTPDHEPLIVDASGDPTDVELAR